MKKFTFKIIILGGAATFLLPLLFHPSLIAQTADIELIPIVNLDAYGTYSDSNTGGDIWGASVSGSMAPVIKYGENLYIIPLYDGSYKRQKFFVHVEEGGRLYNEVQHHDLSLKTKYLATDELTINPYIFGGWDLNVETNDEDWGDGLYDYIEFGSGGDIDYLVYNTENGRVSLNCGSKWYLRHYPNYKALIALATVTAPEEDEKDFNAVEVTAGSQYSDLRAISLDLDYVLLMKFFTDKKIIDADGILKNDERNEFRNLLRLEASYIPEPESGFQYRLISEVTHNTSNQNFYDSRGTTILTDDVFTPDYFDYISFEVNPRLSYVVKSGEKIVAVIGGSYDFLMRNYLERKAQESSGRYTSDEQLDYFHVFEISLEIPFHDNMSWVAICDYTINKSNMDYEQYYEYNYTMHRVLSGISIRY
jgi:hypothetical protein